MKKLSTILTIVATACAIGIFAFGEDEEAIPRESNEQAQLKQVRLLIQQETLRFDPNSDELSAEQRREVLKEVYRATEDLRELERKLILKIQLQNPKPKRLLKRSDFGGGRLGEVRFEIAQKYRLLDDTEISPEERREFLKEVAGESKSLFEDEERLSLEEIANSPLDQEALERTAEESDRSFEIRSKLWTKRGELDTGEIPERRRKALRRFNRENAVLIEELEALAAPPRTEQTTTED